MQKCWQHEHDKILEIIQCRHINDFERQRQGEAVIHQHPVNLNVFHKWRQNEFSLLFHAVQENKYDFFKLLLYNGADPTICNDKGVNVLHFLTTRNLADWAQHCVRVPDWIMPKKQKSDFVNQANKGGITPLISACTKGHLSMIIWLLDNGANINLGKLTGWTPLHEAARHGHKNIVEYLLLHGADQGKKAVHGQFGRHVKARDVTADYELLKLFIKYE